jgi:hypothetical protein
VDNPNGTCAYVGRHTPDELKSRAVGDNVDGTCHLYSIAHLSIDEIKELY